MKKLKRIVGAILRIAFYLAPGVGFALWQWHQCKPLINILAAVGVESLFLTVCLICRVAWQVAKTSAQEEKNKTAIEVEE